jgi:DNA-binding Lrp family transcriptional regulator
MAVSAYVLIQTELGRASDVAVACRKISGVTEAQDVTGPYDVIAKCAADSVDDLGRLIVSAIQEIPGISRTLTCPVVNL